ncbi:right-handed parallel beta-helix repeat-containing protein [Kineococcus gypseus]|uniref:right-handed parallel beta-helix repeat-containing protein n=1 Tax=Kineococcus gypseus TaxID=1637102 RepID=UPI003D7C445C
MRKLLTAAVAASTALVATPAAAAAPAPVRCGDTITQDTTLRGDLVCAGAGLTVAASGVVLDLDGHLLRAGEGPAVLVQPSAEGEGLADVTVRRGRVVGDVAVYETDRLVLSRLDVDGLVDGYLVDDASVRASRIRGSLALQYAVRPLVQGNRIENDTDRPAVSLLAIAPRVVGNAVRAGGRDGVQLVESNADERGTISGNTISGAEAGVSLPYLGSDVDVTANRISDSVHGVAVTGYGHRDVRIDLNDVSRTSGAAVVVEGAETEGSFSISRNRVRDAGGDGIRYLPDTTYGTAAAVVERNDVRGVAGRGIDAPVATGGRNRVRGAGLSPACVGPACR